jgi:hypothetical protein
MMTQLVNTTNQDEPEAPPLEARSEYQQAHKPAREFETRSEYLNHELQIMRPRRWRLNLPGRDFNFEWEDLVPALAGTIGITVMYSAVMSAYAKGFGLDAGFVVENVRVELIVSAVLFVILTSGFFNPRANLAGNHGPMIPLIGLIVAAGGHPLALGIMIAVFGILLTLTKGGSRLVKLTSSGVTGGLLVFLGIKGVSSQITSLSGWATDVGSGFIILPILAVTAIIYAWLAKVKLRWLAIPLCSAAAMAVAFALDAPFEFTTSPGLPNLDPTYWWGDDTGWKLGLPNLQHFIAVTPFAILAVAMWAPDFLGHRVFQELNYPKKSENVLMDVDDTAAGCSMRQLIGSVAGGGNITSSWGTYMIPAAIAKRPIPGGAILLGSMCIAVALLGWPMDIVIWRPVMAVALLVGVFMPLLEAGMQMVKDNNSTQAAGTCILASSIVNPVFGWALAMFLDNNGFTGDKERANSLTVIDKMVIPGITLVVCLISMAAVGMLPGIPALL